MLFCENPKCRNHIDVRDGTDVLHVAKPLDEWVGIRTENDVRDVRRVRFAYRKEQYRWLCDDCITAIFGSGFTREQAFTSKPLVTMYE